MTTVEEMIQPDLTEMRARIARIHTEITVPLPADTPHKEALAACVLGSPAMRSLHPDVEVPITWNWVG